VCSLLCRSLVVSSLVLPAAACAAVFPEIGTRMQAAPQGANLDPPPPEDRHFVRVVKGRVPPRARDGRTWDQVFGSLPDPYVRVIVNGVEMLKTNAASDTLEPTWQGSPSGNFKIVPGDRVEVQLWDASPLNDTPIGKRELKLQPEMFAGALELTLSGDCAVTLEILPAKAVWGAGFWYELRRGGVRVTRVVDASPASRAGLAQGDEILEIDGKATSAMSVDEVRSIFGAIPVGGVAMSVQHEDGATLKATIKEGPIYPLFSEHATLPVKPE
jgi:membrane-associated protease RseP (regulator of RpoE activity)